MEPEAPVAVEPRYTAADCTRLGVRAMLGGVILSQVAAGFLYAQVLDYVWESPQLRALYLTEFARTAYLLLGSLALIGACVGREAYRQAIGSHPQRGEGVLTYAMALLALPYTVPALIWIDLRGGMGARKRIGWVGPGAISVAGIALLYMSRRSQGYPTGGSMIWIQILLGLCGSLAGALIAFEWVAVRGNRRLLTPPEPDFFRFSLRSLLLAVLLLGAFVSGLVLLFGP
ncbi:MAG: hypothetical protein AMXMBFR7_35930 [Planctomycetota bacterium]